MKKLIDITDEDALAVINYMHSDTTNSIERRFGSLELDFKQSHRKYGSCCIEIKRFTVDRFDGSNYIEWFTRIKFHHDQVWFEELDGDKEATTYNKNHIYGYDKLRELGYSFPEKPSWI